MAKLLSQVIGKRAALAAAAAAWGGARAATAQNRFPTRAVSIVVPIPAGGGTDFAARLIAPSMSTLLGQPVVVENRPGGNDVIGTTSEVTDAGGALVCTTGATLVHRGGSGDEEAGA